MHGWRPLGTILALATLTSACAGTGDVCPPAAPTAAPPPAATAPATAAPAPAAPPGEMVHAIFDAGSSGLRLQIFKVTRAPDGTCEAKGPPVADEEMPAEKNARGDNIGLADMTAGHDKGQDEKANLLRMEFPKAEGALEQLWNLKSVAAWHGRITGVALLGTGGFRDVQRIKKGARVVMRKLDHVIDGWKKALGKPADEDWQAITIEGEEEAVLAWLAARELGAKHHATIETGGKTVQYAHGESEGWSSELGTNATKDFLKKPEFEGCTKEKANADKCIAAFAERFADATIVEKGARVHPVPDGGALWVMGGGWKGTLDELSAMTLGHDKASVGTRFKLGDLYRFAKEHACTDKPPRTSYEEPYWCMRVSHAVAFALSIHDSSLVHRHTAPAGVPSAVEKVAARELWIGRESFTRGAAVSGTLFKECHVATPATAAE
jgi:hypothetical protein